MKDVVKLLHNDVLFSHLNFSLWKKNVITEINSNSQNLCNKINVYKMKHTSTIEILEKIQFNFDSNYFFKQCKQITEI